MTGLRFEPLYFAEKITVLNPYGRAGVVTGWTDSQSVGNRLRTMSSQILSDESPIVAITSLYGNGLPQMLCNLLHNPQIRRIALFGQDLSHSFEAVQQFFDKGVEAVDCSGVTTNRIIGTNYVLSTNPTLSPRLFRNAPVVRRCESLDELLVFCNQKDSTVFTEEDRQRIEIVYPKVTDYPSDRSTHTIIANKPIQAWLEVLYRINRFGENVTLPEGNRRALYNLGITISDPAVEDDETLKRFNINPEEVKEYQAEFMSPVAPDTKGQKYTYGNRIVGNYFSQNTLDLVVAKLTANPLSRKCYVSLWDTKKDFVEEKAEPCLTSLFFYQAEDALNLNATFRVHNAVSAWLLNIYGLCSVMDYVVERTGIPKGKLNVHSEWISIDYENAKASMMMELVNKQFKPALNVNDPAGYFTIDAEGASIVAKHFSPDHRLLGEYAGDALSIKNQLRRNRAVLNPDHAIWLGMELAKAESKLMEEGK